MIVQNGQLKHSELMNLQTTSKKNPYICYNLSMLLSCSTCTCLAIQDCDNNIEHEILSESIFFSR